MMRNNERKSAVVCWAATVILICHLAPTTDCLRLKKTVKQAGRRVSGVATSIGVQEGKIVFGKVFRKRLQDADVPRKASSNTSEDDAAYQADSAGWPNVDMRDASAEDKWNRLGTSLHCFDDHMKFRSLGLGASQLAVQQENSSPLPLSMVPQNCGYNMLSNSMVLVMTVPYDGCNMVQQDGSYMLPLQWHGNPVSLWCPRRATSAAPELPHHWLPKHLWHHKPQWSHELQEPQAHAAPQDHRIHFVHHPPQTPQVYVPPQTPQVYVPPQTPQVYVPPQTPQVYVPPQTPQVYVPPQNSQVYVPPQTPQVHLPPQEPQVLPVMPPVYPLPEANLLNPLLSHLFSAAVEQTQDLPKFPECPPHAQCFYPFLPPPSAEQSTTLVPKVMTPLQKLFYSHFPWSSGPPMQQSSSPVPETKPTAAPSPATHSPGDVPLQLPPAQLPFNLYDYLYLHHKPHNFQG